MSILLVLLTVNAGYFSPEEETPFIEHYHGGQHEQQDRLDYFAIRVRRKYLVEEAGSNMEDNSDYDVSTRFIVQPVHQQHIRYNAYQEICTVYPAGLNEIALIVISYGGKRYMPDTPENTK